MEIHKYPDGTTYINADVQLMSENMNHEILFRINSYQDLWYLNQYVDAFWDENKQKPIIIIPNLIDSQADKRFVKGQSSGLKLVCKFLNSMKAKFKIFHPHNPEVVEALMDNVEIIDNSEFIIKIFNELLKNNRQSTLGNIDNLILMSSDAGGFKPLMKLCDKINWQGEVYSASKARDAGKLTQIVDKQDFQGKDILIIDDICIYGGTFIGLAKILKERNIGKLYLAVSHITIQVPNPEIWSLFDKVFTTNSKNLEYVHAGNLEIIKMFKNV